MTSPPHRPSKTPPVTREELVFALRHAEVDSPGAPRTLSEITALVAHRRSRSDSGLRGYHVAPALGSLIAEVDSPLLKAVGSQVRFFARVPLRLGHTTAYYVWRPRAVAYKAKYDRILQIRADALTAATRWQEALGRRGLSRGANATVIIEVPPQMALEILAASEKILAAANESTP